MIQCDHIVSINFIGMYTNYENVTSNLNSNLIIWKDGLNTIDSLINFESDH